jgi:hypothetical protein
MREDVCLIFDTLVDTIGKGLPTEAITALEEKARQIHTEGSDAIRKQLMAMFEGAQDEESVTAGVRRFESIAPVMRQNLVGMGLPEEKVDGLIACIRKHGPGIVKAIRKSASTDILAEVAAIVMPMLPALGEKFPTAWLILGMIAATRGIDKPLAREGVDVPELAQAIWDSFVSLPKHGDSEEEDEENEPLAIDIVLTAKTPQQTAGDLFIRECVRFVWRSEDYPKNSGFHWSNNGYENGLIVFKTAEVPKSVREAALTALAAAMDKIAFPETIAEGFAGKDEKEAGDGKSEG